MWKEGSDQVVVSFTQDPPPDGYEERLNECDRVVMYVAAQAGDGRHRDMKCHIHISLFFCHQLDFPSLPFPVTLYQSFPLPRSFPDDAASLCQFSKRSKRKILQSCVRVHARPTSQRRYQKLLGCIKRKSKLQEFTSFMNSDHPSKLHTS